MIYTICLVTKTFLHLCICFYFQEIKKEIDEETDLAERLCAKVVITSLLRKPRVDNHNNTSADTSGQSGKNFKKFKKVC